MPPEAGTFDKELMQDYYFHGLNLQSPRDKRRAEEKRKRDLTSIGTFLKNPSVTNLPFGNEDFYIETLKSLPREEEEMSVSGLLDNVFSNYKEAAGGISAILGGGYKAAGALGGAIGDIGRKIGEDVVPAAVETITDPIKILTTKKEEVPEFAGLRPEPELDRYKRETAEKARAVGEFAGGVKEKVKETVLTAPSTVKKAAESTVKLSASMADAMGEYYGGYKRPIRHVYENPLWFLLDALMVAQPTAVGLGALGTAMKTAGTASRIGRIGARYPKLAASLERVAYLKNRPAFMEAASRWAKTPNKNVLKDKILKWEEKQRFLNMDSQTRKEYYAARGRSDQFLDELFDPLSDQEALQFSFAAERMVDEELVSPKVRAAVERWRAKVEQDRAWITDRLGIPQDQASKIWEMRDYQPQMIQVGEEQGIINYEAWREASKQERRMFVGLQKEVENLEEVFARVQQGKGKPHEILIDFETNFKKLGERLTRFNEDGTQVNLGRRLQDLAEPQRDQLLRDTKLKLGLIAEEEIETERMIRGVRPVEEQVGVDVTRVAQPSEVESLGIAREAVPGIESQTTAMVDDYIAREYKPFFEIEGVDWASTRFPGNLSGYGLTAEQVKGALKSFDEGAVSKVYEKLRTAAKQDLTEGHILPEFGLQREAMETPFAREYQGLLKELDESKEFAGRFVEGTEKAPHQMSIDEYTAYLEQAEGKGALPLGELEIVQPTPVATHRGHINRALAEGEFVPEEAMAGHEMVKENWQRSLNEYYQANGLDAQPFEEVIAQALKEGKQVPPKVILESFPEMAKKHGFSLVPEELAPTTRPKVIAQPWRAPGAEMEAAGYVRLYSSAGKSGKLNPRLENAMKNGAEFEFSATPSGVSSYDIYTGKGGLRGLSLFYAHEDDIIRSGGQAILKDAGRATYRGHIPTRYTHGKDFADLMARIDRRFEKGLGKRPPIYSRARPGEYFTVFDEPGLQEVLNLYQDSRQTYHVAGAKKINKALDDFKRGKDFKVELWVEDGFTTSVRPKGVSPTQKIVSLQDPKVIDLATEEGKLTAKELFSGIETGEGLTETAIKNARGSLERAQGQGYDGMVIRYGPTKMDVIDFRDLQNIYDNTTLNMTNDKTLKPAWYVQEHLRQAQISEKPVNMKTMVKETVDKTIEGLAPVYYPHNFQYYPDIFGVSKRMAGSGAPRRFTPGFMKKAKGEKGYIIDDPKGVLETQQNEFTNFVHKFELAKSIKDEFAQPFQVDANWVRWDWEPRLLLYKAHLVHKDMFLKHLAQAAGISKEGAAGMLDRLITNPEVGEAIRNSLKEFASSKAATEFMAAGRNAQELWIPKALDDVMKQYYRPTGIGGFIWDKFTQLWRTSVLAFRLGWTYNDLAGSAVLSSIQGVTPQDFKAIYNPKIAKLLEDLPIGEGFAASQKPAQTIASGLREDSFWGPALDLAEKGWKGGRVPWFDPRTIWEKWTGLGWQVNQMTVNTFRRASFIKGLKTVKNRELAEATVEQLISGQVKTETLMQLVERAHKDLKMYNPLTMGERPYTWESLSGAEKSFGRAALDEMQYFLNDWTKAGPIERQIVIRGFWPFYKWYKHMATFVTKLPFDHPGRANALRGLAAMGNQVLSEEDDEYLPEHFRKSVVLAEEASLDAEAKPVLSQKRIRTRSINPVETPAEQVIQGLHPLWKLGISATTGRDLGTGREYQDADVIRAWPSQTFTKRDAVSGEEKVVDRGADFFNILFHELPRQFPQYRMLEKIIAGGRPELGSTLLSPKAITDPETGEPKYPTNVLDEIVKWFGPSVFEIPDVNVYKERRERELEANRRRRLVEYLLENPDEMPKTAAQARAFQQMHKLKPQAGGVR